MRNAHLLTTRGKWLGMGYKQPDNERVVGSKVIRGQEVGWEMCFQHPTET